MILLLVQSMKALLGKLYRENEMERSDHDRRIGNLEDLVKVIFQINILTKKIIAKSTDIQLVED